MIDRRVLVSILAAAAISRPVTAAQAPAMTVYKTASCGCCNGC